METLLDASKSDLPSYISAVPNKWFKEAKELMRGLKESERKYDLEFKAVEIITNKLMGHEDQLRKLKEDRLKFEKVKIDINKNVNSSPRNISEKKKKEINLFWEIIDESRRVLDWGMDAIQKTFFPNINTKCYYPSPYLFKDLKGTPSEQMKHVLEKKIKLKDFETELPDLFDFMLSMQPDVSTNKYLWLPRFFDLRNNHSHKFDYAEMVECRKDQELLVDKVSTYAAEVWNRFQLKIKQMNQGMN